MFTKKLILAIIVLGDIMEEKILELINNIRPYLNMDGGDIEFIKYENHYVFVKLTGACAHCAMQDDTIKNGIEEMLKSEIPEIEGVINVEL